MFARGFLFTHGEFNFVSVATRVLIIGQDFDISVQYLPGIYFVIYLNLPNSVYNDQV